MSGVVELLLICTLMAPWVTPAIRESLVLAPVTLTVDSFWFVSSLRLLVWLVGTVTSFLEVRDDCVEELLSFVLGSLLCELFSELVSCFWVVSTELFEVSSLLIFWLLAVLFWSAAWTVLELAKKKVVPKATVTNPTEIFLKLNFSFPLSLVIKNKSFLCFILILSSIMNDFFNKITF